ncbi:hypothetical protein Q4E40_07645 [Pontibacter sp. BT731]|uniref:hypothetical protein n=1 Tax=Pontibacter coccineus TaxID=3063328 RepID=UPI0026E2134F|nr:hypothetical protein [Pontibacter sp. BT731]MDO6389994.1 hypothetical protein [Pontibacter sp. BT731]
MNSQRGELQGEKLSEIRQGGVYAICCNVKDCPCEAKTSPCPRGFFSLFIQAIYGIELSKRYGIPYYVDFGNHKYLYTEPSRSEQNFWNYYLEQTGVEPAYLSKARFVRNSLHEVYPFRVWSRLHFLKMHHTVVRELKFIDSLEKHFEEKRHFYGAHKVLGVQIRRTDHGQEIEQVGLDVFINIIDRKLGKFDYLFVATDDNKVIELLSQRYTDKLICNNAVRSDNDEAVHSNLNIENRYELGQEALIDCYCLSLCTHSILIQSNISYAALLFNPKLSYTLLEKGRFTFKLKRLARYYLDEIILKVSYRKYR